MLVGRFFLGVAIAGVLAFCRPGMEPTEQMPQPRVSGVKSAGDKLGQTEVTRLEFDQNLQTVVAEGDYEKVAETICGENTWEDCVKKLEQEKDNIPLNYSLAVASSLEVIKVVDSIASSLQGGISLSPLKPAQIDLTDLLLQTVFRVRYSKEELINLARTLSLSTSNLAQNKQEASKYVFFIKEMVVKVGDTELYFSNVYIRLDLILILASVGQIIEAGFNTLFSHNLQIDLTKINSRLSELGISLSEIGGLISGGVDAFLVFELLRYAPYLLVLDESQFLEFAQGGQDLWKKIPTNLYNAIAWFADGLEFLFNNPCPQDKKIIMCWDSGAKKIVFNIDTERSKFMGEKVERAEIELPGGDPNIIVQALRGTLKYFDCSKEEAITVGDLINTVRTIASVAGVQFEVELPNFASFSVCRFFGAVQGSQPRPIKYLILPKIDDFDGDGKVEFAVEFEVSKNFYVDSLSVSTENPLVKFNIENLKPVTAGEILVLRNPAVSLEYSAEATLIEFDGTTLKIPQGVTSVTSPLVHPSQVLIMTPYIPDLPFVKVGDSDHPDIKVDFADEQKGYVKKDYLYPLTPEFKDSIVFAGLRDIVSKLIVDYYGYVGFDSPIFNGALKVDVCSVLASVYGITLNNSGLNKLFNIVKMGIEMINNERYQCNLADSQTAKGGKFEELDNQRLNDALITGITGIGFLIMDGQFELPF